MSPFYTALLSVVILSASAEALSCDDGWQHYKDELCVQVFPSLLNYEGAVAACSAYSTVDSRSSLLLIKEQDMQDYLTNLTHDVFDEVWLGGKYDSESAQYVWEDGEPLTYTNWQDGFPTNVTDPAHCIEFRPENAKSSINSGGKWADVNCQKRNLVICQMALSWTLPDAIEEIKRLRKQHQEDHEALTHSLEENQKDIISRLASLESSLSGSLSTVDRRLTGSISSLDTKLSGSISTVDTRLGTAISDLNSLKASAVKDIRFTTKETKQLWKGSASPDASGYVITGIITNTNTDEFVDQAHRRKVEKYVNGRWVVVSFT